MHANLLNSIEGFSSFIIYFGSSLVYVLIFCLIYCWLTPYDEIRKIREGHIAPAISFGGALIGFILPLASAISESEYFLDMLIWATIAMTVQCTTFQIVRYFFKDLVKEIENNHIPAATLLGFISIAIGVLNAASMTY
jgi:putative membrane protein